LLEPEEAAYYYGEEGKEGDRRIGRHRMSSSMGESETLSPSRKSHNTREVNNKAAWTDGRVEREVEVSKK
jgi:hypothetical protein